VVFDIDRRPPREIPSSGIRRAHQLHGARLGTVVARLLGEAHLGADRETQKAGVQDTAPVEIDLAAVRL
jgi:hypothetical protein